MGRASAMREGLTALVLLAALGAGATALQSVLVDYKERIPRSIQYMPSTTLARFGTFGFDKAVSDAVWIGSIQYFHREVIEEPPAGIKAPLYGQMTDLITDLDPDFHAAYYYGSLFLDVLGRQDEAEAVLRKGKIAHPETFFYPLEMGNLLFLPRRKPWETPREYRLRRKRGIARYKEALKKPDCPDHLIVFIQRVLARQDDPAFALAHFLDRLSRAREKRVRDYWLSLARQTVADGQVETIRKAIQRWRDAHGGRTPPDLESLASDPVVARLALARTAEREPWISYRHGPLPQPALRDFEDEVLYDPRHGFIRSRFLDRLAFASKQRRVARAQERFVQRHGRLARTVEELRSHSRMRDPGSPLWGTYALDAEGKLVVRDGE